jgi:lantibiotic modifying enzyme
MNKEIIELKLKEIDKIIKNEYKNEEDIGVLTGLSGLMLFQFYYSKYLNINENADLGVNILEHIINKINDGYKTPYYCSGIAGFGWTLDFLELNHFIEIGSDDLLENLDGYLLVSMNSEIKMGNYDFLYSSIGHAYYFLNRFTNTKSAVLKEKYKDILLDFITSLKALSEKDGDKIKWLSVLSYEPTIKKGYNLGLAHGISSIVTILSKLHTKEVFKADVAPLLRGATNYILSFKNFRKESLSLFPNWVLQTGELEGQSTVAWCYGDLGIGVALLQASKTLNDSNLYEESLNILKHSSKKRTSKYSKVKNTALCHGIFGNALIFNRIFKETQLEIFKKASDFWLNEGIKIGSFSDEFSGYKIWNSYDENWSEKTSLLNGISGIGLTMIALLSDFDSNWDECLMIN